MVDSRIFDFPLSLILAAVFLLLVIFFRKRSPAKIFSERSLSVVFLIDIAVLIAVEGIWAVGLYHNWIFVAVMLTITLSLAFAALSDLERRSYAAFLSHSGLFLVLFGGLFGSPDRTDVRMQLYTDGQPSSFAVDSRGAGVTLPFSIVLNDFSIDRYEDGLSPKQYTSTLEIDGKPFRTSVNRPCRVKGYRIYQAGYDTDSGRYSVLKIVRDPWLPLLAIGAVMLALAALLSLKSVWNSWKAIVAALALAAVFGVISVARISFGTLAPALRSLWFVPHLIVYMLAYAVMAMSLIAGIASLFSKKVPSGLSRQLLSTASSLLLLGMLCGAVWAKQAWGDYWTWDAKECWAAVTWLLTLAGTHSTKRKGALVFTVFAFLAIQMTWYGVNYLPASRQSLHTYNQAG